MNRLLSLAAAMPWAIAPQWLAQIMTIANREGAGPEAVAAQLGRPLDNTREVVMRGNVAVIPVTGPIFRRANMLSEVSGATSISVLSRDFNAALDSEEVEAIVLEIDSPGGEVSGVSEFADMVYAARGKKPCVGYVGGDGCSAAYWIASACEHLVVSDTAIVGSIGVVRAVPNPNATRAADIEIVSSQSPNKRPNVRTAEGRAVYQAEVDAIADVFVERVARNRGVSPDVVLSEFGMGGCCVGAAAVAAGMADGVGALESVIASFIPRNTTEQMAAVQTRPTEPKRSAPMAATTKVANSQSTLKAEDDKDKGPPKGDDAPTEPDGDESAGPAFSVGDEVMVGDRAATISEVRNGPHYAVEFSDDGSAFQWASEDELSPAEGTDAADDDEPSASDDDKPEDAKARALALENKRLRAMLRRQTTMARGSAADVLVAKGKADKKLTPALEKEVRAIAAISLPRAQALVAALPRIATLASVAARPPKAPGANGANGTWNGKAYGDLSFDEKHILARDEPEAFKAMREAHARAAAV